MPCSIRWCDGHHNTCDGESHSWSRYSTARLGFHADDEIGAGVRWDSDELPAVFVHISGSKRDIDAYMTPAEAQKLHTTIGEAIDILRSVYENGIQIDTPDASQVRPI